LAQSEEHATLDLRVVIPSPMLGVEVTKNKLKKKIHTKPNRVLEIL